MNKVIRVSVDIIIEFGGGVILVKRKNPPIGWALPGGFVEYGESLEEAALREAKEETGLNVELVRQFHTYSAPNRDIRCHTISTVFIAKVKSGELKASSDAEDVKIFYSDNLPSEIVFDHKDILKDYFEGRY